MKNTNEPLDLNGLLELLDGKKEITVHIAAKGQGWIHTEKITKIIPVYSAPGLFANSVHDFRDAGWSLDDAGIIPNDYNDHKTFKNLKDAKRHIK